jgi:hypothetical protein
MYHEGFWQPPLEGFSPFPFPFLPSEWRTCVGAVGEELSKSLHNVRHVLMQRHRDPATFETCLSWACRHVENADALLGRLMQVVPFSEWRRAITHEFELLAEANEDLGQASAYREDASAANGFLVQADRHIQATLVANMRLYDGM